MKLAIMARYGLLAVVGILLPFASAATVHESWSDITYHGLCDNGVEKFLSIPYGQDTGGSNRFKPPKPYLPQRGAHIDATVKGPACPQPYGAYASPLYLSNITEISEDCLHLNVYRAEGTNADAKLPVLLYIHGGSFFIGSKDEIVIQPEGLIKRSVEQGHPIVVVTINYRLGVFGFAQSEALKEEGSENAGLRDQRLAIEWTRDYVENFGGDPERITVAGQSSGGLAVGMQIMAYGASKPLPFQQASCESQALEPGITGNFTRNVMSDVTNLVGCNTTDLQSAETVACLRQLSMHELQHAQVKTHRDGAAANIGDQWLPVVDGDFLPEAPSKLISQRQFGNVTTMIGWCEDDGNFFVGTPTTEEEVFHFFSNYQPAMTSSNVHKLLSLYPSSDFADNPSANLSAQTYRAGRILRDILFTCQPIHYGQAIAKAGNNVYLWDQNQTMFDEILAYLGTPGFGVIHTSNFAYEFGNLSHYDVDGFPYRPNRSDYALRNRQSSSWSSFVNFGHPSAARLGTLSGWKPAFAPGGEVDVYVIGGPHEGLFAESGTRSGPVFERQKLKERCGFLNSPEIIQQLQY